MILKLLDIFKLKSKIKDEEYCLYFGDFEMVHDFEAVKLPFSTILKFSNALRCNEFHVLN